ncbi:MAG: SDR family oxidoreductase [Gammaproteobacteria bacterium]|nr:SDR family oxidoreductase [Gammaproteobacteria bacterium]
MSTIVVTGGSGFIGSHIVEEGVRRGHDVVVLDNLKTGYEKNIKPFLDQGVTLIKGSIMDHQALEKAFEGATTVFHLAALISVPESMEKKREYFEINTLGTLSVLDMAVKTGVKNVVLSSSAAVYGDSPVIPKVENMPLQPLSPYAISKLDGEYLCQLYRRQHGLNATALRYFNVFGPRQDPKSQYAAAVPIFIDKALKGEPITIFGDGEQTRDFIYVKDIVQANYLAAEKGGDVFNVAWGGKITINELAKTIIQLMNSKSEVVYLPERPGDIKHSMANNQKLVNELGFKASSDLKSGLKATIEYFLKG